MKWICFLGGILVGGAAFAQQSPARSEPPTVAPSAAAVTNPSDRPTFQQLMQQSGGSLLRASLSMPPDPSKAKLSQVSFMAVPPPEPKTVKKHDLITIIIREESEMSSEGTTDLKKDANLDAALEQGTLVKWKNGKLVPTSTLSNAPAVKAKGSRDFKGEATVERTDAFTARISAEVIDVRPNGTFAIQARKHVKYDEEETDYVLTGTCRAADLTVDNTVLSWQVHDLSIDASHKGAVRDTSKRGLIPRLLDFVNPF